MEHKGTKRIETERLILRKFEEDDAQAMFKNWASDDEVTKYLTWPAHRDTGVTKEIVREWKKESDKNMKMYQWCIELKSIKEAIGSISAVKIFEDISAIEVGYCIGKDFWHKGIMTEALSAVIDYFFNKVGANKVQASHDKQNPNSGKVMEKCGLKYEGTRIAGGINNSGICDMVLYGIVKNK